MLTSTTAKRLRKTTAVVLDFGSHSSEEMRMVTLASPNALPGDATYNERQAAHLRELAETATTPRLKARLVQEAERYERLARGEREAEAIVTEE